MPDEQPYNPLDRQSLADSVVDALLHREPRELPPPESFIGAGVYAIYYTGDFPPYQEIAREHARRSYSRPVYVGKAIPAGSRKGRATINPKAGPVLFQRLTEHAQSIDEARNLELADFRCRYLSVDDIWIPLGESLLIERFSPIWNTLITGFGNHDPGSGRHNQARSSWDVLHPGRPWADRLGAGRQSKEELVALLEQHSNPRPSP